MSDKVIIAGKLCGWQVSDLHVGISIDAPMIEGDWAALSGRRVRVTVEVVEPDPEPRCPFCGGRIKIEDESEIGIDYKITGFSAVCQECPALGYGPTRQAALDALAEWLKPCPRCGGKAEYLNNGREGVDLRYWVICRNDECSVHSFQFTTKPAAAQWWNKREGRHG